MIKGASIAIICLMLGGFIGNRVTVWDLDNKAEMFFKGKEIGKAEVTKKK